MAVAQGGEEFRPAYPRRQDDGDPRGKPSGHADRERIGMMQRQRQQRPVTPVDQARFIEPLHVRHQIGMGERHAFGRAGGAGGEQHHCHVAGGALGQSRGAGLAFRRRLIEGDRGDRGRQTRGTGRGGEDGPAIGRREQARELVVAELRIERHGDAARSDDRPIGDDPGGARRRPYRHRRAGADAAGGEAARQRLGPRHQRREGDGLAALAGKGDHRRRLAVILHVPQQRLQRGVSAEIFHAAASMETAARGR
jgi:hypothetical protein